MIPADKLTIQNARLLGEFIGYLDGICDWDIPNELRVKLHRKLTKLRETENENIKRKTNPL